MCLSKSAVIPIYVSISRPKKHRGYFLFANTLEDVLAYASIMRLLLCS